MPTERLDVALVQRGLARSRAIATELVKSGRVAVNSHKSGKPSQLVSDDADIAVTDNEQDSSQPQVSRAGEKLKLAIAQLRAHGFDIDLRGKECLDIGASTGGFTQVLLEQGAAQVIALDVGHGQLVPELRDDPQVIVLEGMNARYLTVQQLPYRPNFITCDVSFISLRLMFAPIRAVAAVGAQVLLLIKPQFEVGKGKLGKGGIVRDPALISGAIAEVREAATASGIEISTIIPSPVAGAGGNQEYFLFGSQSSVECLP